MTVRLLAAYGIYPANAIVTIDSGTEAGLIAAKMASANLTGGVVYVPPVLPNQFRTASLVLDGAGNVLGLAGPNNTIITLGGGASITKPATPAAPTLTALANAISVAYTIPADGGNAITSAEFLGSDGVTTALTGSPQTIAKTAGTSITGRVRFRNSIDWSDFSPASNSVQPSGGTSAPGVTSAPVILGTPTEGISVSATAGVFTGSPTPNVVRDWLVAGIVVATAANYTPVTADAGKVLTVRETASNGVGSPAVSTSTGVTIAAAVLGPVMQSAMTHNNVYAGNSLAYGTGVLGLNGSFPQQMQRGNVLNNAPITNSGVPGQTTEQMRTARATQIDQYYVPGKINVLHIWEGTNQLASTGPGTTAASAWGSMKALVAEVLAANPGWKIVLYTTIPRFTFLAAGWTVATINQALLDYNALMLSEGPTLPGVAGVVDLRQNSQLVWGGAGATANNNTVYNADGTHLMEEGYAIVKTSGEAVARTSEALRVTPTVAPTLPVLFSYVEQAGAIRIKITPPTTGGLVENYTVSTIPAATITDSAVGTNGWDRTISGLTNGTAYQLVITPSNSVGTGPALTTAALTPKTATTQLYNFEADTVGNAPANVTAINGALQVSAAVTNNNSKSVFMPAIPADSKAGIFDFVNLIPQSDTQNLRVTRVAPTTSGSEATFIGIRLQDALSTVAGMENYRLGYYLRIRGDSTLTLWRLDVTAFVQLTGSVNYTQANANVLEIAVSATNVITGRAVGGTILSKQDFTYPSGNNVTRIGVLNAVLSYHDNIQLVS